MTKTLAGTGSVDQPQKRAELPIRPTHQRFLLRQRHFTHQYAAMYSARLQALEERAFQAIRAKVLDATGDGSLPPHTRVLELVPHQRAICTGIIYKQSRLLPRFLDEYQKELVRIDAGGEEDGEAMVEGPLCPDPFIVRESAVNLTFANGSDGDLRSQQCFPNICAPDDELYMEDDSGRVRLENIPADMMCTGVVLGVDGTLLESGRLSVHRYALGDLRKVYVPRLIPNVPPRTPRYIAFVCGLELGSPQMQNSASTACARTMVELLVDYLSGAVGDSAMVAQASCITRLVIGGNSIAPTEELRLKKKVKLDPSDHVKFGDDKGGGGAVTSAQLMRELDKVLKRIVCSVEVELMPGDNDMTNAFHPQQPMHPLLLSESARCSSMRLVTNPYEFVALSSDESGVDASDGTNTTSKGETLFFVSSGSNIHCVSRETNINSRLDAMSFVLRSGCACPTAPNTLFSYPFKDVDPFVFPQAPHCFVCCDQPEWQTRWEPLESFSPTYDANTNEIHVNEEGGETGKDETAAGVRLVCVPPFVQTGILVLVDVNSPKLDTTTVSFMPKL
uniref:Uncharacterized protein TCIL3000_3_360 n=1 Tax=Trypanosoma congolense (strain IL3000) TaxID=1068625 RepID=G0UJR8_TRYCI|nr:unnamed protein product [Trypanosoma congolense IL3000]